MAIRELCCVDPSAWGNTSEELKPLADQLVLAYFKGCKVSGYGLFLLEPGQAHPIHKDEQPSEWVTRVHIPIATNKFAIAVTDDGPIHMELGKAYTFNTRENHAVFNGGTTPRIHFVFEVMR